MIKLSNLVEAVDEKLIKKIQKLVDDANKLIKLAIDEDGDKFGITDPKGSIETEDIYLPIEFKNGQLFIQYYEVYSKHKINKETILKRNLEDDGIDTLKYIIRLYKLAFNKRKISYT